MFIFDPELALDENSLDAQLNSAKKEATNAKKILLVCFQIFNLLNGLNPIYTELTASNQRQETSP